MRTVPITLVLAAAVGCAPLDEREDVTVGSVTVEAPPPGMRVWSEVLFADGTFETLGVLTDDDGAYVFEAPDDEHALEPLAIAPCNDGARSFTGFHWETPLEWWFNASTSPLNVAAVESALVEGTKGITRSRNSCGLDDQVSATQVYKGRTSTATQIRNDGTCKAAGDGKNVVGFSDLPRGVLAVACTYATAEGVAVESDIRFNKVDHAWTTSPSSSCTKRFDIQAVMTHERGHTFGLGHVGEADHGALTMSTKIGPCDTSPRTLGKGDVLGLRDLY